MSKKKPEPSMREVQNAAKTLYANIRFMSVDNPIRSIVLTSSVPNEGKTTTSVNLAQAISTSGKRVLLVECDMRRRSLAYALNIHPSAGIYAVLTNEVSLEQAVCSTPFPNLYFLDTEPNIPNPADLLASSRFRRFAKHLRDTYDFVIFDTPPVGAFVDAAVLSALVDATVMVVRTNHVKRDQLLSAYQQLEKANANVIGVCATFVENTSSEFYYAYYTMDGKRVKKDAPSSSVESGSNTYTRRGRGTNPSRSRGSADVQLPSSRTAFKGLKGKQTTAATTEGGTAADSTGSRVAASSGTTAGSSTASRSIAGSRIANSSIASSSIASRSAASSRIASSGITGRSAASSSITGSGLRQQR